MDAHLIAQYRAELSELVINSKPKINLLTMIGAPLAGTTSP